MIMVRENIMVELRIHGWDDERREIIPTINGKAAKTLNQLYITVFFKKC